MNKLLVTMAVVLIAGCQSVPQQEYSQPEEEAFSVDDDLFATEDDMLEEVSGFKIPAMLGDFQRQGSVESVMDGFSDVITYKLDQGNKVASVYIYNDQDMQSYYDSSKMVLMSNSKLTQTRLEQEFNLNVSDSKVVGTTLYVYSDPYPMGDRDVVSVETLTVAKIDDQILKMRFTSLAFADNMKPVSDQSDRLVKDFLKSFADAN